MGQLGKAAAAAISPQKVQFLPHETFPSQKGKAEHDLVFPPSSEVITVIRNWKIKAFTFP